MAENASLIEVSDKDRLNNLARLAQSGDLKARDELINELRSLADFLASKSLDPFGSTVIEKEDVVQNGLIGALDGLKRYDPERGDISTFLWRRMRGAMLDGFREFGTTIKIPRVYFARVDRWDRTIYGLSKFLGRDPAEEEIAERSGIQIEAYGKAKEAFRIQAGIIWADEKPVVDDNNGYADRWELGGLLDPGFEALEKKEELERILSVLTERERHVILLYYLEDMTMKKIGDIMRLSESRVCQLHSRALSKIRDIATGFGIEEPSAQQKEVPEKIRRYTVAQIKQKLGCSRTSSVYYHVKKSGLRRVGNGLYEGDLERYLRNKTLTGHYIDQQAGAAPIKHAERTEALTVGEVANIAQSSVYMIGQFLHILGRNIDGTISPRIAAMYINEYVPEERVEEARKRFEGYLASNGIPTPTDDGFRIPKLPFKYRTRERYNEGSIDHPYDGLEPTEEAMVLTEAGKQTGNMEA